MAGDCVLSSLPHPPTIRIHQNFRPKRPTSKPGYHRNWANFKRVTTFQANNPESPAVSCHKTGKKLPHNSRKLSTTRYSPYNVIKDTVWHPVKATFQPKSKLATRSGRENEAAGFTAEWIKPSTDSIRSAEEESKKNSVIMAVMQRNLTADPFTTAAPLVDATSSSFWFVPFHDGAVKSH